MPERKNQHGFVNPDAKRVLIGQIQHAINDVEAMMGTLTRAHMTMGDALSIERLHNSCVRQLQLARAYIEQH